MPLSDPTRKIGVFLPFDSALTALCLQGLVRAAEEHNAKIYVHGCLSYQAFSRLAAELPLDQLSYESANLDGSIAFFAGDALITHLAQLHQSGHPCVLALRKGGNLPHVLADDLLSIEAVMCRLYRHGHRRIVCLRGSPGNLSANRRYEGYLRGLAKTGLPLDTGLVLGQDFDEEAAFRLIAKALNDGLRFTAIVACADVCAFGAMRALKAHGISVPDQVEVIGYDNRYGAILSDPPLTTFEIPLEGIARSAVTVLIRQLRGESVPLATCVKPAFLNRNSTKFQDFDPILDEPPSTTSSPETLPTVLLQKIDEISAQTSTAEIFSKTEQLLTEAVRLDLDAQAVARAILGRLNNHNSICSNAAPADQSRTLELALQMAISVGRMTRAQEAAYSENFNTTANRLRGLPISELNGDNIAKVLGDTLASLGFMHAGLFLRNPVETDPAKQTGTLHVWNFISGEITSNRAERVDVNSTVLGMADHSPVVFVLPLIINQVVVGNFISHLNGRFRIELGEFIRHLTGTIQTFMLYREILRGTETLRETQRELIEVSRRAGVAEVATGVLHNIGNALNSVSVSSGLIIAETERIKSESIGKIGNLLTSDKEAWHKHFSETPRGLNVVSYLKSLESHFTETKTRILQEARSLREGVEHLEQIVSSQQAFAQMSGIEEAQEPREAMDYSLRLCESELLRHGIVVIHKYDSAPRIVVERHKIVQILVNLLRNAKDALNRSPRTDKTIKITVHSPAPQTVQYIVADNGEGMSSAQLASLFMMGFTTKKGGHGFGLHNSMLTATSIKGSLRAESSGPGLGATFYLTLPAAPDNIA